MGEEISVLYGGILQANKTEWWHFDDNEWERYPVSNIKLKEFVYVEFSFNFVRPVLRFPAKFLQLDGQTGFYYRPFPLFATAG